MDGTESALPRGLRWLDASLPIGRWFGVPVRLHITTIIVPFIFFSWFRHHEPAHAVSLAAIAAVSLYVVIWAHEMGHVVAGRHWNIPTTVITLSPLGGIAHMQAPAPSPKADIVVSLGGPATHLVWLAVLWPLRLLLAPADLGLLGYYTLENFFFLNVALLVFNLLPFFPMDGGRVLRSLLAFKLHPNHASLRAAQVGIGGGVLFVIVGILQMGGTRGSISGFSSGLLVIIGLSNILNCYREMQAARHGPGPYGEPRQPWESDPEAWKSSRTLAEERVHRPSLRTRLRERKVERDRVRAKEDKARLQADLDRLLQRVSEVGMAGLTAGERKALERAAEALRKK